MRRLPAALSAALLTFLVAPATPAQDAPADKGVVVTVNNPIIEGVVSQVRNTVEAARTGPGPKVRTVVFNFNPEGRDAATEAYGTAYELAKYIRTLRNHGVRSIAFVNGKTSRHTVLPVIACDEIVMSSDARIGEVSTLDAPVTRTEQDVYVEMAGVVRAGPVLKMIDKDVKLVQATFKGTPIYADLGRLQRKDPVYADVQAGNLTPVPLAAAVEMYDLTQAVRFKLCQQQADTLDEVLQKYGLSPDDIASDPLGGMATKPVRILIEGRIDTALREKVRRQIETAKSRKENTFFFVLETTGGGEPNEAHGMAEVIRALGRDPEYRARTIAFVPGKAPDVAVFVAFACQEIVMFKGPAPEGEAVIGDFEALVGTQNQPRRAGPTPGNVQRLLVDLVEKTGHSKLLVDGMFDKNLVIVRAVEGKSGERRLMTEDELKTLADKGWRREAVVKNKGELLKLNASRAKDLRIAKTIDTKDVNEVYALYGVTPVDVRIAEPSWLDNFAAFLRRTEVSILLVIIGIAGLVLELKAPGLVVPGVIAAICFILFFWAQTQLGGQLIYLAIMLFLLGLALVGVEIFLIPGFGVTGVCGILLILAGLVLAGLDKAPESTADWADLIGKMLRYGLTMAGAGVLAFVLSRYLPKIPYANRLMLVPPEDRPETDEQPLLPGVDVAVSLLGQVGTATSMLRPSGTAKFGDRYIDVVTEGDFIPPDTPIQVVEVEGTRIVVKRV